MTDDKNGKPTVNTKAELVRTIFQVAAFLVSAATLVVVILTR